MQALQDVTNRRRDQSATSRCGHPSCQHAIWLPLGPCYSQCLDCGFWKSSRVRKIGEHGAASQNQADGGPISAGSPDYRPPSSGAYDPISPGGMRTSTPHRLPGSPTERHSGNHIFPASSSDTMPSSTGTNAPDSPVFPRIGVHSKPFLPMSVFNYDVGLYASTRPPSRGSHQRASPDRMQSHFENNFPKRWNVNPPCPEASPGISGYSPSSGPFAPGSQVIGQLSGSAYMPGASDHRSPPGHGLPAICGGHQAFQEMYLPDHQGPSHQDLSHQGPSHQDLSHQGLSHPPQGPCSPQAYSSPCSSSAQGQPSFLGQLSAKTQGQDFCEDRNGSAGIHPPGHAVQMPMFPGPSGSIPQMAAVSRSYSFPGEGISSGDAFHSFSSSSDHPMTGPSTSGYPLHEQMATSRTGRSLSCSAPSPATMTSSHIAVRPTMHHYLTSPNMIPKFEPHAIRQQSVGFSGEDKQGTHRKQCNKANGQGSRASLQGTMGNQQGSVPGSHASQHSEHGILKTDHPIEEIRRKLEEADQNKQTNQCDIHMTQLGGFSDATLNVYLSDPVLGEALQEDGIDLSWLDTVTMGSPCMSLESISPIGWHRQNSVATSRDSVCAAVQQLSSSGSGQPASSCSSGTATKFATPIDQPSQTKLTGLPHTGKSKEINDPDWSCPNQRGTSADKEAVPVNQDMRMQLQTALAEKAAIDPNLCSTAQSTPNQQQKPNPHHGKMQASVSAKKSLETSSGKKAERLPGVGSRGKEETSRKRMNTEDNPKEESKENTETNIHYTPVYFDYEKGPDLANSRMLLHSCRNNVAFWIQNAAKCSDEKRQRLEANASHPQLSEALSRPPLSSIQNSAVIITDGKAAATPQAPAARVNVPCSVPKDPYPLSCSPIPCALPESGNPHQWGCPE